MLKCGLNFTTLSTTGDNVDHTYVSPYIGHGWKHVVARLHAGGDTEHHVNPSTQGETILKDIINPQPSRTSDIATVVQSIPHQCNTRLL